MNGPMMDEASLIQKLKLIEALFSGAGTAGEGDAAEKARQRILERLRAWEQKDPPVEMQFSMTDVWSRQVFVALLYRYGIRPYRRSGQRRTTVMAKVSKGFVDEILWPEFMEISGMLEAYLAEVTDRVVSQVIHHDSSNVHVEEEPPRRLPVSGGGSALTALTPPTPPTPPVQPKPPTSLPETSAPLPGSARSDGPAPAAGGTTPSGNQPRRKRNKSNKSKKSRKHRKRRRR